MFIEDQFYSHHQQHGDRDQQGGEKYGQNNFKDQMGGQSP